MLAGMTRADARVAVRMAGVLVIGLSIDPLLSSFFTLPWVFVMLTPSAAPGGFQQDWHWSLGFFIRAGFSTLCVLLGIHIWRHAPRLARSVFPEAGT